MKGKRLTALMASCLMLLTMTSCGLAMQALPSMKENTPAASSVGDVSEPAVSVIAPEPELPPEPAFPYTNPLTGEGCETNLGKNRPFAIMMNNHKDAQPQAGIASADIIYEIPAEGGITRMMGVFQDVSGVGEIGTVRSARDYYVSLALGMDALYLHAGGSPQAYSFIKNWGIPAFDCVNGPYEGTLYWRDAARKKSAGLEHSVLTSSEKIQELFPTYGYRLEHKDDYTYPMSFAEDAAPAEGQQAGTVTIKYSNYKTGIFRYNSETGLYYVEQYGKPHTDANTGEQLAVKNVLILKTDISLIKGDKDGRLSVRTTGTGTGQFICGGKMETITWSKPDHNQPMTFTNAAGEELKFGVGTTYINIIGGSASYTVE